MTAHLEESMKQLLMKEQSLLLAEIQEKIQWKKSFITSNSDNEFLM